MIRYSKQFWGLCTLTRWYGSAFPRALPFSVASALLAGLLQAFISDELRPLWLHPYPYQSFAFIAGFMIVFRCALCVSALVSCLASYSLHRRLCRPYLSHRGV